MEGKDEPTIRDIYLHSVKFYSCLAVLVVLMHVAVAVVVIGGVNKSNPVSVISGMVGK